MLPATLLTLPAPDYCSCNLLYCIPDLTVLPAYFFTASPLYLMGPTRSRRDEAVNQFNQTSSGTINVVQKTNIPQLGESLSLLELVCIAGELNCGPGLTVSA